ncbi:MAG: methyltransferase domain-containing protein [Lentisphaerae bacterium]|nr:methyltransferase domain-containing protein [Lentisphaerota bacterium]
MSGHSEDQKINILTQAYTHFIPHAGIAELDMGCGAGSFTVALAAKYPERQIIAADVMLGRLRKVVRKMEQSHLENMNVLRVEARNLIALMLPDASIDRIHILCPDPWPKNRHRGNRLLCSDFTSQLHRVLKNNGIFHFSSDDEYYCEAVNKIIAASGIFAPCQDAISDLKDIKSDFEKRWLAQGKIVHHKAWIKLPLPKITIGH